MSLKYSNLCQLTDTLICAKCREHAVHISSHYTTDWPVQDIPSKFYVTRNHRWEIGLYLTYITAEYQGRSDGGISGYIPPKSAQVNFLRGKNDVKTAIQQLYTPSKIFIPPKQISGYAPELRMIRNSDYVKIIGCFAKILLLLALECFEELNKLSYNHFWRVT